MENSTDADYANAKGVCEDSAIKNLENVMIFELKAKKYCYRMYLRIFKIYVLKYTKLTLLVFLLHQV